MASTNKARFMSSQQDKWFPRHIRAKAPKAKLSIALETITVYKNFMPKMAIVFALTSVNRHRLRIWKNKPCSD
ncbi:MAG: hypothetical protein EBZ69_03615 [Alphaproteobacteria bacterium]|nr:hypothetical protein [Alphaproteobacteria bacterium]